MSILDTFKVPKLTPFLAVVSNTIEPGDVAARGLAITVKHGTQVNLGFDELWGEPEELGQADNSVDSYVLAVHKLANLVGAQTRRGLGNIAFIGDADLAAQLLVRGVKIIHLEGLPANEVRVTYFMPAVGGTGLCDGGVQFHDSTLYVNEGYKNYFARGIIK